MRELMRATSSTPSEMVSCLFTVTDGPRRRVPGRRRARLGLDAVPLLCAREVDVPGAMQRVIRVLVHYYAPPAHEPAHTYLGEAQKLRADLTRPSRRR